MSQSETKKEDALACISLVYKYIKMSDCVQDQRPSLLSDSILCNLLSQIEAMEYLFKKRVEELAYEDV